MATHGANNISRSRPQHDQKVFVNYVTHSTYVYHPKAYLNEGLGETRYLSGANQTEHYQPSANQNNFHGFLPPNSLVKLSLSLQF